MNKLIIFDLDGTLCNTLADVAFYANQALKKFGFPTRTESEVESFMCLAIREIFYNLIGTLQIDDPVIDQVTEYYKEIIKASKSPRTVVYDGIANLLTTIKSRGDKMAILTNKSHDEMLVVHDRLLKGFRFDTAIGLSKDVVPKPDPTEIYNLMKEYGVDKSHTYLVGDGDTDVLAGLNAGINLIAVTYGYRDRDYLTTLGATTFADTPKEVLDLIYG